MIGESKLKKMVLSLIKKNPDMIVDLVKESMKIETVCEASEDGLPLLKTKVYYFGEEVCSTECEIKLPCQ